MEAIWQQALQAALRVRRTADGLHCEANAAAERWAVGQGLPAVELPLRWQALAPRVLAAADARERRWDLGAGWGQLGPCFQGQSIACADGALLWWCEPQAELLQESEDFQHSLELAGIGMFRRSNWSRAQEGDVLPWGDGSPTYWSPQMYRLRGLEPDDARAPDELLFSTMHPDDWQSREPAEAAPPAERAVTRRYRVVWPNGSMRWILAIGRPVHDPQGRFLHRVGINVDVTPLHQAEELAVEAERLARLQRTQGEFLANVSHELRTPLNAVLGFAQLMRADAGEPLQTRQAERLDHMENAGRQLLALVEDMLDMASLHSGAPRVLRADDQPG